MWSFATILLAAFAVAGGFLSPISPSQATFSEGKAEALARNFVQFQRAAVLFVETNTAYVGPLVEAQLDLPQDYRRLGAWNAERLADGSLVAWIASVPRDVAPAMVADRVAAFAGGVYGAGIVRGGEIVSRNAERMPLAKPLADGTVVYVTKVSL